MYLNKFIFPAPRSSYTQEMIKENLIWIERPKKLPKALRSLKRRRGTLDEIYHHYQLSQSNANVFSSPRRSLQKSKDFDYPQIPLTNSLTSIKSINLKRENIFQMGQLGQGVALEEISIEIAETQGQTFPDIHRKEGKCFGFLSRAKLKPVSPKRVNGWTPRNSNASTKAHIEDTEYYHDNDEKKKCFQVSPSKTKNTVKIPCLYLSCKIPTNKTLLFFHSNGEDLYLTYELLKYINNHLLVNVLAVEYPGYGIYKGKASEKQVLYDAEAAYLYLMKDLQIREEDIMIAGRSLGSGPATWLASFTNPSMLILISPFTSIRAVVRDAFGKTARFLIKERFHNLEMISSVRCPVFILHGKNDILIPCEQANKLYEEIKGSKRIIISDEMDHTSFDFFWDFIEPLQSYIEELQGPRIVLRRSRIMPSKFLTEIPAIEISSLQ